MDQLLNSIPRFLLVLGLIALGFFFIINQNPPKTVCDTQLEVFREIQAAFLYGSSENGKPRPAQFLELHQTCLNQNSPGGCYDFFEKLKKLAVDLGNISRECSVRVTDEEQVRNALFRSLKLMTQIAWGEREPKTMYAKYSWFDASEISIFCDVKKVTKRTLAPEDFLNWKNQIQNGLPGADQVEKETLDRKSLFSTPCDAYR